MRLKILFILVFCAGMVVANSGDKLLMSSNNGLLKNEVVLGQNYPNPAKSKTVINVEFSSGTAVLSIYNVLGKLVEEFVISGDKKMITLDVSDYQEGIYLYSIEADGQKVTKRMTVRK